MAVASEHTEYVPLIIAYQDGKYFAQHEYEGPAKTEAACVATVKAELAQIRGSGTVPANVALRGVCIPVPTEVAPDPQNGKATDTQTGEDGSQKL